jgi:hypothetical protein
MKLIRVLPDKRKKNYHLLTKFLLYTGLLFAFLFLDLYTQRILLESSALVPKKQEFFIDSFVLQDSLIKSADTLIDVKDSFFLFIGDSHTANPYGWQYNLSILTGFKYKNTAIKGRTTAWMTEVAKTSINEKYTYCFIWGGGNDMIRKEPVESSVKNIQFIVDLCNQKGVIPVVLTGIPSLCPDVNGKSEAWKNYVIRGEKYKQMLVDSIRGAKVIRTDFISRSSGDCADFICHMNPSGHTKMAVGIRKSMRFKQVSN